MARTLAGSLQPGMRSRGLVCLRRCMCDTAGRVSLAYSRLKPPVRATRAGALSRRHVPATLSRELEEELFRCSEVLSEGGVRASSQGSTYFGSTMISIDLDRLMPSFRDGLDLHARRLLLEAIDGSVRVRLRAMRMARAEAARRISGTLGTALVETRVRLTEHQLHIDVDLEIGLHLRSGSRPM